MEAMLHTIEPPALWRRHAGAPLQLSLPLMLAFWKPPPWASPWQALSPLQLSLPVMQHGQFKNASCTCNVRDSNCARLCKNALSQGHQGTHR